LSQDILNINLLQKNKVKKNISNPNKYTKNPKSIYILNNTINRRESPNIMSKTSTFLPNKSHLKIINSYLIRTDNQPQQFKNLLFRVSTYNQVNLLKPVNNLHHMFLDQIIKNQKSGSHHLWYQVEAAYIDNKLLLVSHKYIKKAKKWSQNRAPSLNPTEKKDKSMCKQYQLHITSRHIRKVTDLMNNPNDHKVTILSLSINKFNKLINNLTNQVTDSLQSPTWITSLFNLLKAKLKYILNQENLDKIYQVDHHWVKLVQLEDKILNSSMLLPLPLHHRLRKKKKLTQLSKIYNMSMNRSKMDMLKLKVGDIRNLSAKLNNSRIFKNRRLFINLISR